MSYLCHKSKKKMGVTVYVSEIKRVVNYTDFEILFHIYSLRHRNCGVRGFIHELFVSKTRTSEVRASEGF